MKVITLIVNEMQTNCYILIDDNTNESVIIDPSDNSEAILNELTKNNCKPVAILLTHGHFDHIGAVEKLRAALNIPVYAHEDEEVILNSSMANISAAFGGKKLEVKADKLFKDNDTFKFGDTVLKVIHTPGHTPGGVCYYCEKDGILFSGDTLFLLSIGRTDFPYGSEKALIDSIKDKLFLLPDETKVFTGHGDSTTIGLEKKDNPCLTDNFWGF